MNDKQDAARRLGETIEIEGEVRVGNSDVPTPVARVTPADLARWRAAADAATEGPWDADVIPHDPEEPCVPEYANLEPNIGAGLTVADAGFIALARIAMPRLLDEVERLRETVTRLNRRAQIAESAINDLTREPIGGREHAPVAAEVWARCEETHGLVCRAAREARAEVSSLRTLLDPDGKALLDSHGGAVGWTDPTCEDQDGYFDSRPACSKCGRFVAYRDVEVVAYHPASGWNGEVIDGHSSHPVCGSGVPVNDVFRWVGWTDPT